MKSKHHLALLNLTTLLLTWQVAWGAPNSPATEPSPNPFLKPWSGSAVPVGKPIPKGQRFEVTVKNQKPITINPKEVEEKPDPRTAIDPNPPYGFKLLQKGDKLILSVFSTNPLLAVGLNEPFLVSFTTQEGLELNPDSITEADWPRESQQAQISVTGKIEKDPPNLVGTASFSMCNLKTKRCEKKKQRFTLSAQ